MEALAYNLPGLSDNGIDLEAELVNLINDSNADLENGLVKRIAAADARGCSQKVEVETSEEEAEGNDRILEDCKKAGFFFKAKDPLGHRFDRWLR